MLAYLPRDVQEHVSTSARPAELILKEIMSKQGNSNDISSGRRPRQPAGHPRIEDHKRPR